MLKAKRAGQSVYAVYTKTNHYGHTPVQMYEYTYMGQLQRYQSESRKQTEQLELYINPNTGKAYSQYDITKQIAKICIMGVMALMTCLMGLPFKEAFTNW